MYASPLVPCFVSFALSAVSSAAQESAERGPVWDARSAEHLLNRAGFGGTPEEIDEAVRLGLAATVERLVRGPSDDGVASPQPVPLRAGVDMPPVLDQDPALEDEPTLVMRSNFYPDRGVHVRVKATREYCSRWIDRVIADEHPLRDRMTLFWHGHFVSSVLEVESIPAMLQQIEFLHTHALGDFETLVEGIGRDPAMLEYLNNDINEKAHPNENWARELMELFTLGEGHYSEDDIKEAARAFTGWTRRDGEFAFARDLHDYGPKTVLGVTGNLDGDAVTDILLEQERCAHFLAEKLIQYFEGAQPAPERIASYAALLRAEDFRIAAFLRALFLDPSFYREEVLGNRVAAPLEYFLGTTRRLGIEPPSDMLYVASSLTGQTLLAPPNVKGWEEGLAWLTTSNVMQRSNLVGILLGAYDRELRPDEILAAMIAGRGRDFRGPFNDYLAMNAWMQKAEWNVALPLAEDLRAKGATTDDAMIRATLERLLPVPFAEEHVESLRELVEEWKAEAGVADRSLVDGEASALLERLVHVILSLPEAQVL